MNETNYNNLIARWLAEDISTAEKETLFTWLEANEANRRLLEEAEALWKVSENYGKQLEFNTAQAWDKVERQIETEEIITIEKAKQKPTIVNLNWRFFLRTAAVFFLLGMSYWWYNATNSREGGNMLVYTTQNQEQKEIKLPDGSVVWLNENSSLSYEGSFEDRLVVLKGEALFDIVKKDGKKFEIQSGKAKTTVLGTSFNVRAYPKEDLIEVTVISGKVALSESVKEQKVFLEPGDVGVWYEKEERLAKNELVNENATAWKTKKLIFQDQTFANIFKDLERYFDVEINTTNKGILKCSFTGDFKEKELKDILRYIQLATGIEFEKTDNKIQVKGEGC